MKLDLSQDTLQPLTIKLSLEDSHSHNSTLGTDYLSDDDKLIPTTPILNKWIREGSSSPKPSESWSLDESLKLSIFSTINESYFESRNFSYLVILLFGLLVGIPCLLSLVFIIQTKPCDEHSQLMIIRHAEKPDTGDDISREGECRAMKLSSCFNGDNLQIPDMLFTYIPTSERSSLRGLETLLPISKKLSIPIYTYRSVDWIRMLDDIRTRICGKTLLLAWHHNAPGIRDIALEFGVNKDLVSAFTMLYAENYDVVWMIDYASDGEVVVANLTMEFQGLGINPCKAN